MAEEKSKRYYKELRDKISREWADKEQIRNLQQHIEDVAELNKAPVPKLNQTPEFIEKAKKADIGPGFMEEMTGAEFRAKQDILKAEREALKEARLGKIAEKVEESLDYGDLKKQMMKKAGKFAKGGLKALPLFGALGAYLASGGQAEAAVPVLNEAEPIGPEKGTLEYKLESGVKLTPEEIEQLKNRK